MQELQTNYRGQCGEDEANARRRLDEVRRQKRDARVSEANAVDAQRERDIISREQCDEMYRIVHRRRQTLAAMTPGERADFDRFESNWKARCRPG
ncbi:MAG TPA: hypothetical protein VFF72_12610 [Caldimonas sp.]|nr:hypothetical protein [Caldimonas sp.]